MLPRSASLRRARPFLGTMVDINVEPAADVDTSAAMDAAFGAIERVHRLMSFHADDSDVARINAAAAGDVVAVDPWTFQVLERAAELSRLSGGLFDITVAPRLVARGFLPRPQAGGAAVDPRARHMDLECLAPHAVRWRRKGWIDLGGIAKGDAVDRAVAALQAAGVQHGVVNAGGDLRCFGQAQPVHVRQPAAPTSLVPLGRMQNAAIATSAGYFAGRGRAGRRMDPLVDPARDRCVSWDRSVSVVADTCLQADALTKIVRLAHTDLTPLLHRLGAQALVVTEHRIGSCGVSRLQPEFAA